MNSPAVLVFWCVFWVFVGVVVCFWFLFVCPFVLHGDSSMDYVSILLNSLLYAHCRHD